MGKTTTGVLGAAVGLWLTLGSAEAAVQTILGARLQVKNDTRRRVSVAALERGSANTIVGSPTTSGGSLRVVANGGTSSDQTFALPASGWRASGSSRFKFSGGAVRKLSLRKSPSGTFGIRVVLDARGGTVDVVPPNPGDDGGVVLTLAGGDDYCVLFGGAAGGTEQRDDARRWQVRKPTAEGCPAPSTPTTTSTSIATSTTTSTLPDLGQLLQDVTPAGDVDHDGFSNTLELASCSNPADPASTPENDASLCANTTIYADTLGPAWGNTDKQTEPGYDAAVVALGVQNAADCGAYCATTPDIGSPAACSGANWPYTGVPDHGFYEDGETVEVTFPDEDGNVLHGTIFLPPGVTCTPDGEPVCDGVTDAVTCSAPGGGTYPAVVITDGFLASQRMYFWAAHRLARQGYIAMTFDVSGQGRSQGVFPNADDDLSADVNDQSPFSRDVGTAMNFVVSGANPVRDLIAIDELLIVNQGTGAADHTETYVLGTAGHSYGARGSITYQQSTETAVYPVRTRAVVAWSHFDNAGTIGNVPIQMHSGDEDAGFIQPPGSGNIAPEMERRFDRLGGDRDLDGMLDFIAHDRQIVMIADATHISWSQGPWFYYPTWAEEVAYHYTLAWFDKYLKGDIARSMSDVSAGVINGVDAVNDYAECTPPLAGCYTATERLKLVHVHLSDTWCSRFDVGGDVSGNMKGTACSTE